MRRLLVLLLLPLVAGCLLAPDEAGSAQTSTDAGCTEASKTVLAWTAPEESDTSGTADFTLEAGTTRLDVAWTEPTVSAGGHSVTVTAPDGVVVFERTVDSGAAGPGGAISVGGDVNNRDSTRNPPPLGTYAFAFDIEGVMEGASLVVTATGCWATQAP